MAKEKTKKNVVGGRASVFSLNPHWGVINSPLSPWLDNPHDEKVIFRSLRDAQFRLPTVWATKDFSSNVDTNRIGSFGHGDLEDFLKTVRGLTSRGIDPNDVFFVKKKKQVVLRGKIKVKPKERPSTKEDDEQIIKGLKEQYSDELRTVKKSQEYLQRLVEKKKRLNSQ